MMYNKKGFTLVEIAIVIVLIGLFFVITSSMTKDSRTPITKAERLANHIYDITRTTRNNILIGRWTYTGGTLVTVSERTVFISNTWIITRYFHDISNSGTESSLIFPFFDNDKSYRISNIAISSWGIINGVVPLWDNSGMTSASIIMNPSLDNNISIVTVPVASIPNIRTLKITAEYLWFEQSVVIDRVTGAIETRRSNQD